MENRELMDNTPIGAWGYFGYSILFNIPIIGFIIALTFALSSTGNINRRNYARSYFCSIAVIAIIVLFLIITNIIVPTSISTSTMAR